jgi:hypothetical protein
MLTGAVTGMDRAGVHLGRADRDCLALLARSGPATVAVIASLLHRALTAPTPDPHPDPTAGTGGEGSGRVRALLVPADPGRAGAVVVLPVSSVAFSDAIGGGLLDDAHHDTIAGTGYCAYLDETRTTKDLAINPRAHELATRLGWAELADTLDLRGDVLIVGTDPGHRDLDVPTGVLTAATATGLLPPPTHRWATHPTT